MRKLDDIIFDLYTLLWKLNLIVVKAYDPNNPWATKPHGVLINKATLSTGTQFYMVAAPNNRSKL